MSGIAYELQRQKRRTLTVTVTDDGRVVARAPLLLPKSAVDRFVAEKADWIRVRVAAARSRPAYTFADGELLPFAGGTLRLAVSAEAKRAAAILAGQGAAPESPPAKAGEYVILIGAFANEDNVKNLRAKLAEKNVKTYVEALDTPGSKKTRVRAGPFASREAAEKALERMKQVGVSGVISGK